MVSDPVAVDPRPSTVGSMIALVAAIAATMLLASAFLLGAILAGIGTAAIGFTALGGPRDIGRAGVAVVLGGVLAAGLGGASPTFVLAATVLVVVAWDAQANARSLGQQVGRRATTIRAELAHTGGTLIGGTIAAGAAIGAFIAVPGGWPLTAIGLVFLGAALLLVWLEG